MMSVNVSVGNGHKKRRSCHEFEYYEKNKTSLGPVGHGFRDRFSRPRLLRLKKEVLVLSLDKALQMALEKNKDIQKAREYRNQVEGTLCGRMGRGLAPICDPGEHLPRPG